MNRKEKKMLFWTCPKKHSDIFDGGVFEKM